jgi:hypothetical protein
MHQAVIAHHVGRYALDFHPGISSGAGGSGLVIGILRHHRLLTHAPPALSMKRTSMRNAGIASFKSKKCDLVHGTHGGA